MPLYRYGAPGEDSTAHLNFGRKSGPQQCGMPRFEKDNAHLGDRCARMSVALCDAPHCDVPICELHRVKHPSKSNTDYCLDHKHLADEAQTRDVVSLKADSIAKDGQ